MVLVEYCMTSKDCFSFCFFVLSLRSLCVCCLVLCLFVNILLLLNRTDIMICSLFWLIQFRYRYCVNFAVNFKPRSVLWRLCSLFSLRQSPYWTVKTLQFIFTETITLLDCEDFAVYFHWDNHLTGLWRLYSLFSQQI